MSLAHKSYGYNPFLQITFQLVRGYKHEFHTASHPKRSSSCSILKHSAPILSNECFQRLIDRYGTSVHYGHIEINRSTTLCSQARPTMEARPALNHKHDGLLHNLHTLLYAATRWIELHYINQSIQFRECYSSIP